MRIDSNVQSFNYAMNGMAKANADMQSSFLKRDDTLNNTQSNSFTNSVVKEIELSKVAQAQLVAEKTKNEVLDTTLEIYA